MESLFTVTTGTINIFFGQLEQFIRQNSSTTVEYGGNISVVLIEGDGDDIRKLIGKLGLQILLTSRVTTTFMHRISSSEWLQTSESYESVAEPKSLWTPCRRGQP